MADWVDKRRREDQWVALVRLYPGIVDPPMLICAMHTPFGYTSSACNIDIPSTGIKAGSGQIQPTLPIFSVFKFVENIHTGVSLMGARMREADSTRRRGKCS